MQFSGTKLSQGLQKSSDIGSQQPMKSATESQQSNKTNLYSNFQSLNRTITPIPQTYCSIHPNVESIYYSKEGGRHLCKECAKAELNGTLSIPNDPNVTPMQPQVHFTKGLISKPVNEALVTNKSVQLTKNFKTVYNKNRSWFEGDNST